MQPVEIDDVTQILVEFANGVSGAIEANWCATGRTMQHDFEIYGSRGALYFSQERLNELHFFDAGTAVTGVASDGLKQALNIPLMAIFVSRPAIRLDLMI